jgi:hypothetical protein
VISLVDADEHPHAPGPSSAWSETWEWRLVLDDGSLALTVALVRRPSQARLSYLFALVGRDRATVSVVEHDIAAPRRDSLELRASGIWADHICEQPFSHWNLGLEAFGLTLDEPDDAVGDARGIRTPVGLDLEWEDDTGPSALDATDGYLTAGRAHGEILVGVEEHDVVGAGHRLHRWGNGPSLLSWTGRGAVTSPGVALPRGVLLGRAVADDGMGEIVEWTLVSSTEAPGEPPALSSRAQPAVGLADS